MYSFHRKKVTDLYDFTECVERLIACGYSSRSALSICEKYAELYGFEALQRYVKAVEEG